MNKLLSIIKKAADVIASVLLVVWQLPQTILGVLLLFFYQPTHILIAPNGVRVCYSERMSGAISLGYVVIMPIIMYRRDATDALDLSVAKHEWKGHGLQSLILGWLYLIVIGLSSLVHAAVHDEARRCAGRRYDHFFTERWAEHIVKKHARLWA